LNWCLAFHQKDFCSLLVFSLCCDVLPMTTTSHHPSLACAERDVRQNQAQIYSLHRIRNRASSCGIVTHSRLCLGFGCARLFFFFRCTFLKSNDSTCKRTKLSEGPFDNGTVTYNHSGIENGSFISRNFPPSCCYCRKVVRYPRKTHIHATIRLLGC